MLGGHQKFLEKVKAEKLMTYTRSIYSYIYLKYKLP